MITYHPFGSRGYKNLQIWDMNAKHDERKLVDNHLSSILMNDQEPIYLDAIKNWKYEQQSIPKKKPFFQLYIINSKTLPLEQLIFPELLARFDSKEIARYQKRISTIKDPVAYYNDRLDDISWVARLMFTGTRTPIVVHSELRSPSVKELCKEFVPLYVFWHGLIARDWYRHWKHNKKCYPNKNRANTNKRFLLYARDYSGTRKYREHFVKQLITNHLAPTFQYQNYPDEKCLQSHFPQPNLKAYMRESPEFIDQFYNEKVFEHSEQIRVLVTDQSSAFINTDDYNSTAIQVVAETLFENQRIHLTEKTFQPMVAGQPFVTLSAPGTLEILKYYGFQTFDHIWDESYDKIKDPAERMSAVIDVIKYLNKHDKFEELYEKCMPVCEHNRNHFFSNRFESQILSEYDHNWRSAIDQQNEIAKFDPGGSFFWFMNENITKLNFELTDFEQRYIRNQLRLVQQQSNSQYKGILKQYDWAKEVTQSH